MADDFDALGDPVTAPADKPAGSGADPFAELGDTVAGGGDEFAALGEDVSPARARARGSMADFASPFDAGQAEAAIRAQQAAANMRVPGFRQQPAQTAAPEQNWWVRNGIATPDSPVGREGLLGAIESAPRRLYEWWRDTPSALEQSAEIHRRAEAVGGIATPEGREILMQDPMLYAFGPGEGLARGGQALREGMAARPVVPAPTTQELHSAQALTSLPPELSRTVPMAAEHVLQSTDVPRSQRFRPPTPPRLRRPRSFSASPASLAATPIPSWRVSMKCSRNAPSIARLALKTRRMRALFLPRPTRA